ncbi:MAG: cobaltochelatase CobS [Rickettsiales bacterium]|jgi:cobaltochelatase CobS
MTKNLVKINCQETFGFDCDFEVLGFKDTDDLVPKIDENYVFDPLTSKAILASLMFNQKTLIQGMHGTGKSTHIEQVCARLNWQVLRVNFDSQITRMDLVGKDVIVLEDGKQVTQFKRGIIPYALTKGVALVLDEYDAIRTDVSFVIQRLLEEEGKFALLEENKILSPHENFRLFATSNTIGMGDDLGIYHGTNLINQAQMDRWNIVANLHYLDADKEIEILQKKLPFLTKKSNKDVARMMVQMANLTREGFSNGDLSNLMSLRTLISWGKNFEIFGDVQRAFNLSFLNKLIDEEKLILKEYYQRVFS